MRKDVIFGMSIGGVMIAVVVVYLTVALPNRTKPPVTLDTQGVVLPDGPGEAAEAPADTHAADGQHELLHSTGVAEAPTAKPTEIARADSHAAAPAAAPHTGQSDWFILLQTGQVAPVGAPAKPVDATPAPVSKVPTAAPAPDAPRATGASDGGGAGDADVAGPGPLALSAKPLIPEKPMATDALHHADTAAAIPAVSPALPATNPANRLHRIQKNENFYTIAASVYGNASMFKYIVEANPTVDPHKLQINQEIVLPDLAEIQKAHPAVAPDAHIAPASDAHTAAAIIPPSTVLPIVKPVVPTAVREADSATEYTVVSGDNLHRIAVKLYGNINNVDALYELNRDVIGPDPAKLKIGMVLKKLPVKPDAMR